MKILVAEDSDSFALLYKNSLELRGHQVTITRDGMDCIFAYTDALKEQNAIDEKTPPYDLVILDHRMPRIKGLEVAKEILKLHPNQRIMLVTAFASEMMQGVREVGGKIELMEKPFPSLAMVRQVEGLAKSRWKKKTIMGFKEWDGESGFSEIP